MNKELTSSKHKLDSEAIDINNKEIDRIETLLAYNSVLVNRLDDRIKSTLKEAEILKEKLETLLDHRSKLVLLYFEHGEF